MTTYVCTLGLKNLQELSLDNTAITDEGVKHISELRNLAYLSLSDTKYLSIYCLKCYHKCVQKIQHEGDVPRISLSLDINWSDYKNRCG